MTKRLYFEDATMKEFDGRIEERLVHEGRPAVILDRTCFYPESGGQPSDRGSLGGAEVLHVFEDGDRIVHVLDRELREAEEIRGVIDWGRRFDHMQQHSGQHVLSQCFIEVMEGETRSFHLGETASTLEIGLSAVSDSDLEKVERRANELVFEDREIKTYFVEAGQIPSVPLRRPPKKEGTIRVVEVDGFDYSACGGTHCRRTGEVGLIKIVRWDRIRNNLRFEFLCGHRARLDYAQKNRLILEISQRLSVQDGEAAEAVEKAIQDAKTLRKRQRQLREELTTFQAAEAVKETKGVVIKATWTDRTAEEAKSLALSIIRLAERVVLFAVRVEARGHLVFACSEGLALDMRELIPLVSARVPSKGGGRASLVELVTERDADLEGVLSAAQSYLEQKLASLGKE